jgi:hypothetical protein
MRFWHAIRRFISVSWLVAAPLVIVFLIFVLFLLLKLLEFLIGIVFGPEAAEAFVINFFLLMGMLFWPAIIGVPIIWAFVSNMKSKRNR